MAHDALEEASELLRRAADASEDTELADALSTQADQLVALAARDRGPNQGRLVRHQHVLWRLQDTVDGDAAELLGDASALLSQYRKTI